MEAARVYRLIHKFCGQLPGSRGQVGGPSEDPQQPLLSYLPMSVTMLGCGTPLCAPRQRNNAVVVIAVP